METFYHITSAIDHPALPDDAWETDFRSQYPCGHRPHEHALDVVLKEVGEDVPLGMVSVGAGAMIRTDFRDLLESAGRSFLEFGRVCDTAGQRLPTLHTLGSDYKLQLRGGPQSTRQFCQICGQFLYYPFGPRYVLKTNLIGRPIYYSEGLMFGLLVSAELYKKIEPLRLKKICMAKMPVRDTAQDGLPLDLRGITPAKLSAGWLG